MSSLLELRVENYRHGLDDIGQVFDATKMVAQAKGDLATDVKVYVAPDPESKASMDAAAKVKADADKTDAAAE